MLVRQVEAALTHWQEPGQGLWEVRGPAQHFTASKVLCWVAADRGVKLAQLRGDDEHAAAWRKAADEIHADVRARGTDDRGGFCQHYETTALDASLLLIPLLGFLPADDERVRATVLAIADELTEDELVLRYRAEETDDGFSGEEGTFTICSFWLVSALTEIGEVNRARGLCEKLLSHVAAVHGRVAGNLIRYFRQVGVRLIHVEILGENPSLVLENFHPSSGAPDCDE
jgi:alpha,alpha-trehalase